MYDGTKTMDGRLSTYRTAETLGKSQLDLIVQVYDGAITAFRAAAERYRSGDYRKGYEELQKARRLVTHLYTTLNPQAGGGIADNLGNLYAFVLNQTSVAEATKDLRILDDNIGILNNVRVAWLKLQDREHEVSPTPAGPIAVGDPRHFSGCA
ncbi:MAG TPA: flagellar export chaperone FliS [Candidatus Deferrimicrobium sp.]|nr:flagellar export chaperone FliS [Candidatus Deferrimicrobium sp.]